MKKGMQHPSIRPIFCWRPLLDNGIPILREIFAFVPEMPNARFQESDTPNLRFLPIGQSH